MPLPAQLPPTVHDFTARDAETRELVVLLTCPARPERTPHPPPSSPVGRESARRACCLRVAHAVRPDFPDGQLYDSIGHTDPAEVAGQFLAGLGVPEHAIPSGSADRFGKYRSVIAQCRVLVVLYDVTCESQVAPLMPGSGESRVLVSSRYWLVDLERSRTIQLGTLDDVESLGLLARAFVHACAGLPLALRVVGLRLMHRPNHRLDAVARRLADPQRVVDELQFGGLAVRTTTWPAAARATEPACAPFCAALA
ncbi:hypothetical protein OHO28_38975 [Streptomyces europaeiscabiei]|uniref:hypothetical protein n=1 Tax=Streptomyces europaeiscabiei TaxID=146819 RepID=UPI002E197113